MNRRQLAVLILASWIGVMVWLVRREYFRPRSELLAEAALNVSPTAVHRLQMGNEVIEFSARFGGVARQISVPVANVYALYARETGHGMTFEVDAPKAGVQTQAEGEAGALLPASQHDAAPSEPGEPPTTPRGGGRPTLRRVK